MADLVSFIHRQPTIILKTLVESIGAYISYAAKYIKILSMIVDLANVGSVSSGRDEDCSIVARNEYQFHKLSPCVLHGVDPRWTQVPGGQ